MTNANTINPAIHLGQYRYSRYEHGASPANARKLATEYRGGYGGHPWHKEKARTLPAGWGNPPFGDNLRWVEKPETAGLRFVGFADELASNSVRHTGWYLDPHGEGFDLARGVVYQMTTRKGKVRFVAGVMVSYDYGRDFSHMCAAAISLDDIHEEARCQEFEDASDYDAAIDCALAADECARIYAENEQEYRENEEEDEEAA